MVVLEFLEMGWWIWLREGGGKICERDKAEHGGRRAEEAHSSD